MAKPKSEEGSLAAEATLRALVELARAEGSAPPEQVVMMRRIPEGLIKDPERPMLYVGAAERDALHVAVAEVRADPRLEHLGKRVDDEVWNLLCAAALTEEPELVENFMSEHARLADARPCYMPVENLIVSEACEVAGATLLPVDHPDVPGSSFGFSLEEPVGSVIAVNVEGTDFGAMYERAAGVADHALRVARVAMRAHRSVHNRQLRFHRSIGYSFGEGLSGWQISPDAGWSLEVDHELKELMAEQPVADLSAVPDSDIEKKAVVAVRWMERAMLAEVPLEALLLAFFALEALLGDRSEGLKAHGLAYRRAMLSVAVRGSFAHPNRIYTLYDQVRSDAVHGNDLPTLDDKEVRAFVWDVRVALDEYLRLAAGLGLRKRGKLLKALDKHEKREEMIAWLRENAGPDWQKFLYEL
jgi:hypothetical protein